MSTGGLSTNKNTMRDRQRIASMNEDKLAANRKRKAVNEQKSRVRAKLRKQAGWDQLSGAEQEAKFDAAWLELQNKQ